MTGHIVGRKNKKFTNIKKIKLKKKKIVLKKGKKAKVKAKLVKVDKKKRMLSKAHAPKYRYASDDPSIAKVSKKGVIKAKKRGKTIVYVYAKNGYAKKIKVTVK